MGKSADRSHHREHAGRARSRDGMIASLGWVATALVVASYFCSRQHMLRKMQMAGAVLWMMYGLLIGASPGVVANVLVFSAAAWTANRRGRVKDSKFKMQN